MARGQLAFFLGACLLAVLQAFDGQIVFGQSASFSGATAIAGQRLQAGILAAFQEVNLQGGVAGKELKLISVDDQYSASKVATTASYLLGLPDMIAFIGCYGSPTTLAMAPILKRNQILDIAPTTGSAAFRVVPSPYMIHLRAGYGDENFAMLNFLFAEKKVKRIGVLYQADSYGLPAKDGILEALEYLGLQPSRLQSYNKETDNVTTHDFAQDAQQWYLTDTQAIIMYGIGNWVLSTIQQTKLLYRNAGKPICFLTCSFMGTALTVGLQAMGVDPSNVYMAQVYPHPESDTLLSAQYRKAIRNLEGEQALLDYLSLEGYTAARFSIKVLQTMNNFSRIKFLAAVDEVKMVSIAGQVAGPFSSDCNGVALTLNGARSSLCNCSQGFRFVELTAISPTYTYVPISQLQYPISECYATPSSALQPLVIYAQLWPAASPWAATMVQAFNHGMQYASTSQTSARFVSATYGRESNTTEMLQNLVDGAIVAAVAGAINVPEVDVDYPLVAAIHCPAKLANNFTQSELHVLPTLQQEIYAWVYSITRNGLQMSGQSIHVIYPASYPGDVVKVVQRSCAHFAGPHISVASSTYANDFPLTASLGTNLTGNKQGHLFVFGLQPDTPVNSFTAFLRSLMGWQVYVPFMDITVHWELGRPCGPLECDTELLSRTFFVTNLPNWWSSESELVRATIAQARATGRSNITALELLGYIVHSIVYGKLVQRNTKVTAQSVLNEWYWSAVHTVYDFVLGPYCADSSCRCNVGARTLSVYQLGPFLQGMGPATTLNLTSCTLDYSIPDCVIDADCQMAGDDQAVCLLSHDGSAICSCSPRHTGAHCQAQPKQDMTPLAVGIPVGVVGGALFLAFLYWALVMRGRRSHSAAPKDSSLPFCVFFTDIQASTHLWATIPEEMALALNVHHKLIRDLVIKHNCYEVKTIGDSFMCASKDPAQAVQFAVALQSKFFQHDWGTYAIDATYRSLLALEPTTDEKLWNGLRVRIGIHYGIGDIILDPTTKSYDYYGTVVNVASRIESACHGGQITVSEAVFDNAKHKLPKMAWQCLGMHSLRGVSEPMKIFQVSPVELAGRKFPALKAVTNQEPLSPAQLKPVIQISDTPLPLQGRTQSTAFSHQSLSSTMIDEAWAENHPLVTSGEIASSDLKKHYTIVLTALRTLLATQTKGFKKEVLKGLCDRLQVTNYGAEGKHLGLTLHGLVQRVLPATVAQVVNGTYLRRRSHLSHISSPRSPQMATRRLYEQAGTGMYCEAIDIDSPDL